MDALSHAFREKLVPSWARHEEPPLASREGKR